MRVMKLDTRAVIPNRAHSTDAGLDLYALLDQPLKLERCEVVHEYDIETEVDYSNVNTYINETNRSVYNQVYKINTGIAIELPPNTVGMICDRSSKGNQGIIVLGGIIDEGYRGELIVMLANIAGEDVETINPGDKIAQLLIIPILKPDIEVVDSLPNSDRNANGFGSSGR